MNNNHVPVMLEEVMSFIPTHKKINLKTHMKVHQKMLNPDKIPKCSECDKSFGSKKALTVHLNILKSYHDAHRTVMVGKEGINAMFQQLSLKLLI